MEFTGVFHVVEPIEEIGGRPGDRLVIRPGAAWRPYSLVRPLTLADAHWAFSSRAVLDYTVPAMPHRLAYRRLREAVGPAPHLRLLR